MIYQCDMWQKLDGDNTFAIEWPNLTKESTVLEVGAYEGRWAKQIATKYQCHVHAFEPQDWAYTKLVEATVEFPNLIPYNYGLYTGPQDAELAMGEFETDACSTLYTGRKGGYGRFRNVGEVLDELSIKNIDLMMVNIEGSEYDLLGYMLGCGLLDRVKVFCVQWHIFADPCNLYYSELAKGFREAGFTRPWSFYPTLEAWVRE